MTTPSHRVCVAPMMDWTTRHYRAFARQLTKRALLYTEMVTVDAILHGDRERLIGFDDIERPLALQVGGNDPQKMASAAGIAAEWGYDEVNINVGCPSDRVQSGRFGACLMREPGLVAGCVSAMREHVGIPVTVKTRIGVDDDDSYEFLTRFATAVCDAGAARLVVHARKALLSGLSPKQNREIPPLDYPRVYRLADDLQDLPIVLNGGITDLGQVPAHLQRVAGVMLGRLAYKEPYTLAKFDGGFFGGTEVEPDLHAAVTAYLEYARRKADQGVSVSELTRHLLGLFNGQPGARTWRRMLSDDALRKRHGVDVIAEALAAYSDTAPRPVATC